MFDRQLVDMPLSGALVKRILGRKPTLQDLEVADPELATGLKWVLSNSIEGILDSTFSVLTDPVVDGDLVLQILKSGEEEEEDEEEEEEGGADIESDAATPKTGDEAVVSGSVSTDIDEVSQGSYAMVHAVADASRLCSTIRPTRHHRHHPPTLKAASRQFVVCGACRMLLLPTVSNEWSTWCQKGVPRR